MKYRIDINADLGEGKPYDEELMQYISSCSIACGGHFGNETSMTTAVRLAKQYNVKVGAHPSFPDKDNFGRKQLTITKEELTESVFFQLLQFYAICENEEISIHHIKLHGALYNYAAMDAPTADAVVEAITQTKLRPKLYVPYNSVLHRKAENLMEVEFEAFIDRRYDNDGKLVTRSEADAIISDPAQAWQQLVNMIVEKKVTTKSGIQIPIKATTYCIHGDHPNSVSLIRYISERFEPHSIVLK